MNRLFLCLFFISTSLCVSAQPQLKPSFGLYFIHNWATQLLYDIDSPKNYNQRPTLWTQGAGIYYEQPFRAWWSIRAQLSFQTKGSLQAASVLESVSPIVFREDIFSNRFDYLTLEVNPSFYFFQRKQFKAFVATGLHVNALLRALFEEDDNRPTYPYYEDQDLQRFNFGYNLGTGFVFKNLILVEFKLQGDQTPLLKDDYHRSLNFVGSLNLGININEVIAHYK